MGTGGLFMILQVERGWHSELVPLFDDQMEKWSESWRERSKRPEEAKRKKQVGVMKEDNNKSFFQGMSLKILLISGHGLWPPLAKWYTVHMCVS